MKKHTNEEVVELLFELTQRIADEKITCIDNNITRKLIKEKGLIEEKEPLNVKAQLMEMTKTPTGIEFKRVEEKEEELVKVEFKMESGIDIRWKPEGFLLTPMELIINGETYIKK